MLQMVIQIFDYPRTPLNSTLTLFQLVLHHGCVYTQAKPLHCLCHFSPDTVAYFLPNLLSVAASDPQRPVDGSLRQKASLAVVGV